jgi:hypothetical protein
MPRSLGFGIMIPALVAMTACGSSPPPPPTPQAESAPQLQPAPAPVSVAPVSTSPLPPPPSPSELVPPPPPGSSDLNWQPGHWRWTGNGDHPWLWVSGGYVQRPPDHTQWVVGQWQPVADGWTWVEGHWE